MNKLYLFALTGMNYGNANTLSHEFTGEKKILGWIKEKLPAADDLVIFDVGANEGNYSTLVSEVFNNKKINVYSFEPSKHSFERLIQNTQHLPCIQYFNFGFGRQQETANIYSNYEGSGATTLYKSAFGSYALNKNISEKISLKTIDEFCTLHSIHQIDLLKIDVEGHELAVLEGAINIIKRKAIKFIQFEFGPCHVYSRTFFKDFWDLLSPYYTICRIISDGLLEIKTYTENLEVFRTANFLAELNK